MSDQAAGPGEDTPKSARPNRHKHASLCVGVEPAVLDSPGACAFLGNISERALRKLVEDGHIKPLRLPSRRRGERGEIEDGRRVLFEVDELRALVEKLKRERA